MSRIILSLAVCAMIFSAGWIIFQQLKNSPRFRRFVLREDPHDKFMEDASEMSKEASHRKVISEQARAKLREDEEKLERIFDSKRK